MSYKFISIFFFIRYIGGVGEFLVVVFAILFVQKVCQFIGVKIHMGPITNGADGKNIITSLEIRAPEMSRMSRPGGKQWPFMPAATQGQGQLRKNEINSLYSLILRAG